MHRRGRPLNTSDRSAGPLLAVKYAVPPVPGAVVPRARLESRLDTAAKLTVVAAPAGWGKTSLVSRWAAGSGTPVAWVSLDESDDEPVRFWSYVLAALRRVGDDVGPAPAEALQASGDGPIALALPLLLNELAAASTRYVLVLDDYHVITHPDVHDGVEFLVSHLPPTLRLVIAGRSDPPLPLARMRVRGELTELRAENLRFSDDESVALLSAVTEAEPDPGTATAVLRRAEGWAAGLQLAAVALRNGAVSLPRGHLVDYVTAEVLPALAPAQHDLLVRTASLELLSGPLCDAALDVRGSAAVLAELERAALFVVALDRDGEWYRCHRLLRDALGWSPGAEPDDTTRDVLRRASRWFSGHGRDEDAIRCLQNARDHEAAAALLESGYARFLDGGGAATYLALGERLPESAVGPALALNLTYAAEVTGNQERVVHWLDVCDRHIDATTVLDAWRSPRAAEQCLRGLLATDPSDPGAAVALCERGLALETAAGTEQHPVALMMLGLAYGFAGRFDDAARLLTDSWRRRGQGLWATGVDLQIAGQLGLFLLALGADDELDGLLTESGAAADAAERDWGEAAAASVVVLIRLVEGRRSYQRGDLATAGARIARGLACADVAGRALYSVVGLLFLADAELGSGDRAAARAALVRARDVVDDEPVAPFLRGWLDDAEARIGRAAVRAAVGPRLLDPLTDREMSVLRLLPGTATQREIGAALFLSINTVKAYTKSLYRKLGVGSRQDAVRAARALGLI